MSQSVDLLVDFCDYKAAKYAVMNWHYSKTIPTSPRIMVGVWENKNYIGCVVFSRGANNNMLRPYNLIITDGCELTRVALSYHISPVSQIVSRAIKKLKEKSPNLRLIISYADPLENHYGGIYQAMNWVYSGKSSGDTRLKLPSGKLLHSRQFSVNGIKTQYGEKTIVPSHRDGEIVKVPGKHRYLYPLDRAMHRQIEPLSQPYPKRADS